MNKISIAALFAAVLLSTAAIAQVTTGTGAGATGSGAVTAGTSSVGADVSVDVSASTSTSVDVSSALSSVESGLSSAESGLSSMESSMLSSELSSSDPLSQGANVDCDTFDSASIVVTAMEQAQLQAFTAVNVRSVDECASLADLAAIDAGTNTMLGDYAMVNDALTAAGKIGNDIIGYSINGTTLTVYVRDKK